MSYNLPQVDRVIVRYDDFSAVSTAEKSKGEMSASQTHFCRQRELSSGNHEDWLQHYSR